ncbi:MULTISPECIES: hypothetical protein [Chryseobacterium]|uniref:hypothetical protein n=1 Tax=Chryseobacterium TaxID=59732 RepID=UPI000E27A29D|nr:MULTISPECIES: hypothetical protein [Chryseobacterium]REC40922.1 hypothetical protein DRF69_16840 [Chryseobacterium sp. 5_R23647]
MKTFDKIKSTLDNLETNIERKKYLKSIQNDPNIGRHDLRRIVCNTMEETNFIESYYKVEFENNLKTIIIKIIAFFEKK